jgi:hypothetical protein
MTVEAMQCHGTSMAGQKQNVKYKLRPKRIKSELKLQRAQAFSSKQFIIIAASLLVTNVNITARDQTCTPGDRILKPDSNHRKHGNGTL